MNISYMNVELGTKKESVLCQDNQDIWILGLGTSTNYCINLGKFLKFPGPWPLICKMML